MLKGKAGTINKRLGPSYEIQELPSGNIKSDVIIPCRAPYWQIGADVSSKGHLSQACVLFILAVLPIVTLYTANVLSGHEGHFSQIAAFRAATLAPFGTAKAEDPAENMQ